MKKQLFLTVLLFCSSVLSFGQFLGENFYQNGDNRIFYNTTSLSPLTVSVGTSFTFNLTDVVIPATVSNNGNTYAVTGILIQGFQNRNTLISISIPDSVTKFGENAFYNCTNLETVTINNSSQLNIINYQSFYACDNLTSINIPDTVLQIKENAFDGCSALSTVSISNTSSLTTIENSAFNGCSSLTSINIPNTVNSIGEDAFSDCSALTSITFPSLVTNLASSVLYNCSGLTSFTIPNTITSIGFGSFYGCTGLTSITIPNSVTFIDEYAFQACTGLTSFTFPDSISTINQGTLYQCSALTSVIIPSSVTAIQTQAFASCTALTSVTVNNPVPLVIDENVFQSVDTYIATLYVPTGTGANYEAAPVWTNFNILEPIAASQSQINVTCFGGATAEASIEMNNGVAPFTFVWSNGGTSALQTELTAGTYTCIVTDAAMNSITLTFTITQPDAQPDNVTTVTECGSYEWNGTVYNASGIYSGPTTNCVTEKLNLTITPSTTNTTTVTAFGNYIWPVNGETLSTTLIGYEFPNGNCNTEILNLTIIPATVAITNENGVLTAVTNAPNATYQWYNCATEQNIAGQTGATLTLTQSSGSYNVTIRINGILSGSAGCFNYSFLANNTFSGIAGIDLYPNPSNGIISLKLPTDLQIEIYNNLGQMLSSEKMFSGANVINIADKPTGVYFLKANDGNNVSTFKIMKN